MAILCYTINSIPYPVQILNWFLGEESNMKWKKQLCAAAAVLLALGIALAGVLLNQHFLVLSGGISRTEIQSPLGDLVRSHLQLVALIVFATLAAAILALYHYKKQPELRYFLLYLAVLFSLYNFDFPITNKHNCLL